MKALLLLGPGSLSLGEVEPPDLLADWVSVTPLFVGLCGSDVHVFEGHVPVQFPVALGHEVVGIARDGNYKDQLVVLDPVEGCGTCDRCRAGTENVCADVGIVGITRHGGLAQEVRLSADRLYPVPAGVTPELAATTEALAVAVHAVDRGNVQPGDSVAIFGGGPIGLLTAITARDRGAKRVVISEPAPRRRRLAERLGFDVLDPAGEGDAMLEAAGPDGADVVFDAAAHSSLPPRLTRVVRSGGTIVVIGLYQAQHPVDLSDLVTREITLAGTRALTRRDTSAALEVLTRCSDDLSSLIDDVVQPEATADALGSLARAEAIKVLVDCSTLT